MRDALGANSVVSSVDSISASCCQYRLSNAIPSSIALKSGTGSGEPGLSIRPLSSFNSDRNLITESMLVEKGLSNRHMSHSIIVDFNSHALS